MPATDDEGSPPPVVARQATPPREMPEHISLVSAEGERFRVSWAAAQQSETIRAGMAEEGFAEAQNHEMHFAEIRSAVLKKVVEYLEWHYTYKDAKNGTNVPDFAKGIEPEISLELLQCADFLAL